MFVCFEGSEDGASIERKIQNNLQSRPGGGREDGGPLRDPADSDMRKERMEAGGSHLIQISSFSSVRWKRNFTC